MKIFFPPKPIENEGYKIFLAGTIDMGNSFNWQQNVIAFFNEIKTSKEILIINPRRENWDSSWVQRIENKEFNEQVSWELDALENADLIMMYISEKSMSPISMLELGLFANSGKILVCCEANFWRKGNIDIVCKRKNILTFETLDTMLQFIKNNVLSNI